MIRAYIDLQFEEDSPLLKTFLKSKDIKMNFNKKTLIKALAFTSIIVASNVYADPIYVDLNNTNVTPGGQPTSPTGALDRLILNYASHTSVNLTTGVITTVAGVDAIGVDLGILGSPIYDDFDDMLCGTGACGSFNTVASVPGDLLFESFGTGEALTYGLSLTGSLVGGELVYSSGTLSMYDYSGFNTGSTSSVDELWTSTFTAGGINSGYQYVNSLISTSMDVTAAGQDIFFLDAGSNLISFEDYLDIGIFNTIRIAATQSVVAGQLGADIAAAFGTGVDDGDYDAATNTVYVSAAHNADLTFAVSEPSSIAILGLSLLGFAGVARRKNK
jgi:hypothetical protein